MRLGSVGLGASSLAESGCLAGHKRAAIAPVSLRENGFAARITPA